MGNTNKNFFCREMSFSTGEVARGNVSVHSAGILAVSLFNAKF